MEGLLRVGLLKHFQRSEDNRIRIIPRGLPNKGMRVRQNLSTYGVAASKAVFVDDDADNITEVAEVNPGINQLHCSAQGLTAMDCKTIVSHFQKAFA
mmetsp:Transcript_109060/g.216591  ORF Transcript_109060/g.216591 Transcript_109060/m.216591 type:complete len:97 (+) Transcript_109060:1-291(+)